RNELEGDDGTYCRHREHPGAETSKGPEVDRGVAGQRLGKPHRDHVGSVATGRADGTPRVRRASTSGQDTFTMAASPCPPPPHSAAAPRPPPRRRSSFTRVSSTRVPDMPMGW